MSDPQAPHAASVDERALRAFAEWIVSLDEPEMSADRRIVTLAAIILRAKEVLGVSTRP